MSILKIQNLVRTVSTRMSVCIKGLCQARGRFGKDDRLLPAGVDFIEPRFITCKYYKGVIRSNIE